MVKSNKIEKYKVNKKVVVLSIIGLISIFLAYFVNWLFILICAAVIFLNQKELMER